MKESLLFFCLLIIAQSVRCQYQATLSGTVKSLNGSTLPQAHVTIEPWTNNRLFGSMRVQVNQNGSFNISIPKSGLYRMSVKGVLHKQISRPLWVRKPDTLQVRIHLDPKNLDDGKYFDSKEYLSWIKVIGDFNGYNYDKGIPFKKTGPKTLQVVIKTSLDTIRYQIFGLTHGTVVLPGADGYELRDQNNYQGILSVDDNTVVITYKADSTYYPNKNSYEGYRTTWDPKQSKLEYSESNENEIHNNLDIQNILPNIFNYKIFDNDSLPAKRFQIYMDKVSREIVQINIQEMNKIEDQISRYNNTTFVNKHYLQSLYIRYLLLSENLLRNRRWENESDERVEKLKSKIDADIVESSILSIPPYSQLWSLRNSLITILPEILGYRPTVLSYLEKAISENSDNTLTGNLLLNLFKWSYDNEGKSERTQNYYQLILDYFGDKYYARKAREYVQKN